MKTFRFSLATLTVVTLALTLPFAVNAAEFEAEDIVFFDADAYKEVPPIVKSYVTKRLTGSTPSSSHFFQVTDTGYTRLSDQYTTVSVSISEIKPYAGGSEIVLQVINWMGVTLTDVKFKATVLNIPIGSPRKELAVREVSIPKADPGKECFLTVRLTQKPEDFNYLKVEYLGPDGIKYDASSKK